MKRDRSTRHRNDLDAARVVERHVDPIMQLVSDVVAEVGPGQRGLTVCQQDARLAIEIAERLDALIPLPEPLETWDRPVLFAVALLALGIWRGAQGALRKTEKARKLAVSARFSAEARAA